MASWIFRSSLVRVVYIGIALSTLLLAGERRIEGVVIYKGGEPAANAAVQVEDTTTLVIVSRITDRDGHFQFLGLNPDKEYVVRAIKRGYWSKAHTVSRFSSRTVESVTLSLVPSDKN